MESILPSYSFKGKAVAKGNDLLNSALTLRKVDGSIVFDITLKNVSNEKLIIKNPKKDIIIHDISCKNNHWEIDDVRSLLIYPSNNDTLRDSIEILPNQQINISFPMLGAEFRTYWGLAIWNKEFDETVDLSKCSIEIMKTAPACNRFDVAVYFVDGKGKEYKAFTSKRLNSSYIQ